jgi:hypothetical protein
LHTGHGSQHSGGQWEINGVRGSGAARGDRRIFVDPANATRYHGDAGWDTSGTGPAAASTTAGGGFISGTVKFAPVPLDAAGKPSSQISPAGPYDCYNITTLR